MNYFDYIANKGNKSQLDSQLKPGVDPRSNDRTDGLRMDMMATGKFKVTTSNRKGDESGWYKTLVADKP